MSCDKWSPKDRFEVTDTFSTFVPDEGRESPAYHWERGTLGTVLSVDRSRHEVEVEFLDTRTGKPIGPRVTLGENEQKFLRGLSS